MKIFKNPLKGILKIFFSLAIAFLLVILFTDSFPYFLEEDKNKYSDLWQAPLITKAKDLEIQGSRLCWIKGQLKPLSNSQKLITPYTKTECLYYVASKYISLDDDDDDSWYLKDRQIESNIGSFLIENIEIKLMYPLFKKYDGLFKISEKIKYIDNNKYKLVEEIIPLVNEVWILTSFQANKFTGYKGQLLITLNHPEVYLSLETHFFTVFLLPLFLIFALILVAYAISILVNEIIRQKNIGCPPTLKRLVKITLAGVIFTLAFLFIISNVYLVIAIVMLSIFMVILIFYLFKLKRKSSSFFFFAASLASLISLLLLVLLAYLYKTAYFKPELWPSFLPIIILVLGFSALIFNLPYLVERPSQTRQIKYDQIKK